jgi:hypothetical protein
MPGRLAARQSEKCNTESSDKACGGEPARQRERGHAKGENQIDGMRRDMKA